MEFNWKVVQMDRLTADGFVVTVHYTVNAVDGDYTASTYGTVGYTEQPNKSYIPYASLTKEEVIGWVQDSMGVDAVTALQENLDKQIENQINPPIITPPLPWSQAVV